MNKRINKLEAVGLELSGMKEVLQLLGMNRHKEVNGDIFGFLEACLERYANIILENAEELKNVDNE